MAKRLPPNAIRLYHRGTPAGHSLYPVVLNERFSRTQNAPWPRRVVTGPVGADAEEFISSWTQDDYSGGFGILDANESTDTSRIAFGVIDGRRPKSMCLPPETVEITSPTWTESGGFYPLGDVGTQFYGAWANGISGWKVATQAWHTTQNAWPASFAPLGEAVAFCGGLFVPGGAQGFVRLSELTAATGTLTVAQLATVPAVAFGLYDGKLWAIDTSNKLWMLTPRGAAAGATTLASWGTVSDPGVAVKDAFGNYLILDTSLTPTALINYPNAAGVETLWCITRGQGAYLFNPDEPRWIKSSVREGAHPDWGYTAEVFRDGEDLFIAGGGLDLTRFTTANVEVPLSGPSKDQGVPPTYQGSIVDLVSERSTMYALIAAGTSVAAGSPTSQWVLQDELGALGATTAPLTFNTPSQVAVDSTGRALVADTANNRLLILTAAGVYVNSISGLSGVTGVATDSADNIYVASVSGSGIALRKYSSALALQWTQTITTSGGVGHVATDSTYVYVTDTTNDIISKRLCTTGSQWVLQATYGPTYNGLALSAPAQIALNAAGTRVYIADYGNDRLVVTDGSGVYVDSITSLTNLTGVAVDSTGNIYTLSESGTTMRLRQYNSSLVLQWTSNFGDDGGQNHLATDGTHVWACDLLNTKVWKRLCSTGAAVSAFGSAGASSGAFGTSSPYGIIVDGTHLYVGDPGNDRVQKFLKATGVYVTQWAAGAAPLGLAFDATGNILIAETTTGTVRRYTAAGTLLDTFAQVGADGIAVASGDVVWVTNSTAGTVAKWDELATLGATGSGNGQFDTPLGIDTNGTHLWVVDQGNSRVQKITVAGVYVAKWSTGAGSRGLALDASGDVWVCNTADNLLSRYSEAGVAQTSIAQSTPRGIGITAATDVLYVSTSAHTLAIWDEESVTSEAVAAITWLGGWTGTSWCALWESATVMTPTWMRVSMKGDYALWWGNAAGTAYRQLLPPPFFNPAARITLGVYPFAATGWMESVRFDAQMSGWDKIASHFFTMLDYAAADTYVDVSYRTDVDQFDSGLLDPPYRPWKRVDHIGRTLCWFDDTETDPTSGLPWHEGESFQWIQFRYDFVRGSDRFVSPIWLWHSMHFLPIPQDAATFQLKIPIVDAFNRSADEIATTLRSLQTERALIHLQTGNARPSNPDWETFFRVKVTQVKSEFVVGADNHVDEVVVLNCVEIGASSNAHTTVAADTP